jgi:hypothetical protein
MGTKSVIAIVLASALFLASGARAQNTAKPSEEFKKWEGLLAEYKGWLDSVGVKGYRFWIRLDGNHRPHRLYVGEGFDNADYNGKEQFVETFSRYLAGHPEKYMLIDLFDGATGVPVGEFGWGGFKLYPTYKGPVETQDHKSGTVLSQSNSTTDTARALKP